MITNLSFSNLLKILQMLLNSPENNFIKLLFFNLFNLISTSGQQGSSGSRIYWCNNVSFLIYCVKLLLMNFYRADDIMTSLVVSETRTVLTDQFFYFGWWDLSTHYLQSIDLTKYLLTRVLRTIREVIGNIMLQIEVSHSM